MHTSRLMLILTALCMTSTGCSLIRPAEPTEPRGITTCPVRPKLSIVSDNGVYLVSPSDMKEVLHYVTDLEYAAGCR